MFDLTPRYSVIGTSGAGKTFVATESARGKPFNARLLLSGGMKFCPSCGTQLGLLHDEDDASTGLRFRCPECGYAEGDPPSPQGPKATDFDLPEKAVVIIGKEQELRTTPTDRAECPKCHNNLAYVWQVQTRSADEGATQFFRCTQCGYTWRLYT